ncbi:MAG: hypothetical protein AAF938_14255 [Myxococcota bacterium]
MERIAWKQPRTLFGLAACIVLGACVSPADMGVDSGPTATDASMGMGEDAGLDHSPGAEMGPAPDGFDGGTCDGCDDGDSCTIDQCVDGACMNDPIVCDEPPASVCLGDTARMFDRGTCSEGSCEYTPVDEPCPLGCVAGACIQPCGENEHVQAGRCVACTPDEVRPAGDDPSGEDTFCEPGCETAAECVDPARSRCGGDSVCIPCVDDADCSHIGTDHRCRSTEGGSECAPPSALDELEDGSVVSVYGRCSSYFVANQARGGSSGGSCLVTSRYEPAMCDSIRYEVTIRREGERVFVQPGELARMSCERFGWQSGFGALPSWPGSLTPPEFEIIERAAGNAYGDTVHETRCEPQCGSGLPAESDYSASLTEDGLFRLTVSSSFPTDRSIRCPIQTGRARCTFQTR